MIRPITVICWILALGAGLYLYHAKHETKLLDERIEQIAQETSDVRADSRRLLDDWLRLGEPEQLHKYSDEYLGLKTIAPTQFARVSDLATLLPPPEAQQPEPQSVPVANAADAPPVDAQAAAADPAPLRPAAVQPAAVQPAAVQAAAAQPAPDQPDASADTAADANSEDLPVPPIPPTMPVQTAAAVPSVGIVPLQARPITPRPAATETEDKPRPATEPRYADAPRSVTPKPEPVTYEAPRPAIATRAGAPAAGSPDDGDHGLPPLQAQMGPPRATPKEAQVSGWRAQGGQAEPGQSERSVPARPPRDVEARESPSPDRELPPLQAQGSGPGRSYAAQPYVAPPAARPYAAQPYVVPPAARPYAAQPYVAPPAARPYAAQPYRAPPYSPSPAARAIPWPTETHVADARPGEPRGDLPPRPQFGDPRGPQMTRPVAMPESGSLLGGVPRGSLPAPTPVSATWTAPPGTVR